MSRNVKSRAWSADDMLYPSVKPVSAESLAFILESSCEQLKNSDVVKLEEQSQIDRLSSRIGSLLDIVEKQSAQLSEVNRKLDALQPQDTATSETENAEQATAEIIDELADIEIKWRDLMRPYVWCHAGYAAAIESGKAILAINMYVAKSTGDVLLCSTRAFAHEIAAFFDLSEEISAYIEKPPKLASSSIMATLGTAAGAVIGGMVGVTLNPVVGEVIGPIVGGVAGDIAGKTAGAAINSAVKAALSAPQKSWSASKERVKSFKDRVKKAKKAREQPAARAPIS